MWEFIKGGKERGYSIINTSESRQKFINKIERMFKKVVDEKNVNKWLMLEEKEIWDIGWKEYKEVKPAIIFI